MEEKEPLFLPSEFWRRTAESARPEPKKKYGEPGSIMKTSDGRLYEVQKDGSWRRIRA
jgi:hypothetical protein